MPQARYSLGACNLKLAKGYSYKSHIAVKRRGLLLTDGAPGARSGLLFGIGMGGALLLTVSIWASIASPGIPLEFWIVSMILYIAFMAPAAIHLWRKPAEARKVLLDCRNRCAELRVDDGVVEESFRAKVRKVAIVCSTELFKVEPVNVGLGMYAVVIDLDGYPFAVAASRSADKMLAYLETLNEALHESMTR
ncbi:MAG: hypothetical protein NCW75_12365 [Phycisphaera sp.]|nr:MAG: hypothetical protein NCW75_12365 [Phycisphaera sp.]